MGNQLTKEKVLEINALEPLPYEKPAPIDTAEIEVVDEENVSATQAASEAASKEDIAAKKPASKSKPSDAADDPDGEGQTTLF